MTITGANRYLEDYTVGARFEHRRGHTISVADNQMLSLLTMNTAQTHFNTDSLTTYLDGAFPAPLLNACVALALAVGLTSEDMTENTLGDVGYTGFRMPSPLFVGDTLYATSEVLAIEPAERDDAGILHYRITATKPDGTATVRVERKTLIKRRSHWLARDTEFAGRVHGPAVHLLTTGADPARSAAESRTP